ncbi:hypothetical protein NM208_g3368 [Fusarium decemcellulare]|uniref:Uncharacterized protein n=1 Tax=Fusarium decemcellulare TaxID=57161 RepID=A0ACC1SP97_9HYPO|nr:hypothetical protein NM208_g3368 [Fusarium decemcellulare]
MLPAMASSVLLFNRTLFSEIKNDPLKESRVKRALRKIADRLDRRILGTLLVNVAKSSCSVSLAKELVDLGAPIDYPKYTESKGMTALQLAAKKTTKEAAFFMQWLILNGASPHPLWPGNAFGDAKGAASIVKWVGKTWEELLAAVRIIKLLDGSSSRCTGFEAVRRMIKLLSGLEAAVRVRKLLSSLEAAVQAS